MPQEKCSIRVKAFRKVLTGGVKFFNFFYSLNHKYFTKWT